MKCIYTPNAITTSNLARPFRNLAALTVIVLMIFAVSIPIAQAQNQQYQLTWVESISGGGVSAGDINDSGVVVGRRTDGLTGENTAFRFFEKQPGSWVTEDLMAPLILTVCLWIPYGSI